MFKVIVDNHIFMVLMGICVAAGILSKLIVSITLKKLVKAASDMSKSSHSLMRLVRAKFEHTCMVSDKVQNISVFAQKYIYEYKVLGLRLHKWQYLEMTSVYGCLFLGAMGAWAGYQVYGMTETVFRIGATGAVEAVLLFLLHRMTDEKYQMAMLQTYMVDYLENVCAHRVEKNMRKEERKSVPAEKYPAAEPAIAQTTKPLEKIPVSASVKEIQPVAEAEAPVPIKKQEEKKEKFQITKEARIREILEEFLA